MPKIKPMKYFFGLDICVAKHAICKVRNRIAEVSITEEVCKPTTTDIIPRRKSNIPGTANLRLNIEVFDQYNINKKANIIFDGTGIKYDALLRIKPIITGNITLMLSFNVNLLHKEPGYAVFIWM